MAAERARLAAVDPPINSLGDEMVLFAAGPALGRALPFAFRAMGTGATAIRGMTAEAEQALAAYARSTMNRLGRMPTAEEVLGFFKLGRHAVEGGHQTIQHSSTAPSPTDQDQQPDWGSPNARWTFDASGQAVMQPGYGPMARTDATTQPDIDLGELFRWIATEAQERTGRRYDKLQGANDRTFQTYTKRHLVDDDVYAGRTSGFFSPKINVERRAWANYPSPNYHDPVVNRSSALYSAIRGREQQLIDYYRAMGISDNVFNGIYRWNPLRSYYMRNAEREFGRMLPGEAR